MLKNVVLHSVATACMYVSVWYHNKCPDGASIAPWKGGEVLSRKFWSGKKIGPGDQYSRRNGPPGPFFFENIGPSAKILVRLAMVNGKPATIVYSEAVVSF